MKIKGFWPFILLFCAITGIEIWGEELFDGQKETALLFISKPLLMPVLLIFLWRNTRFQTRFDKFVAIGLVLAWIGDILLMFNNDDLFVFGLASFLLCHIFYIAAFVYNIKRSTYKLSAVNKIMLGLLPLFYLIVLYSYLYPNIMGKEESQPFIGPVTVYAVTIVTMSLFALWRIGSSNRTSVALIIFGAFVFMISDSLIAQDKFVHPIWHSSLFIMFTYCLAQLCITIGTIKHHNKKS